ncbi:hypothetical protein TNCV_1611731 [Trichonephila clavipes]|nr:hypothetical protein TNCV_1611731 [Trichonephila clavipes]
MIIGALLAEAPLSGISNFVGISRTTVSCVIIAYTTWTTGRVFVWRTSAEAFHVDCLVPTVKHGECSVMVGAQYLPVN